MNIPFDEMPDNSRIWIYQADRPFSKQEEAYISNLTGLFLEEWAAHGAGLNASYAILYNQFLVIAVDEAMVRASGCSIDKQVHFIQNLEKELLVSFMDRTKVAILKEERATANSEIITTSLHEIKKQVAEGEIHSKTLTFNNLVQTKGELDKGWIVSAENSWLKRYL